MKRLWICGCFALLCGACDDKTADEPVWNGDNYVTAFSLTVGEAIYEAVVHDGRITVDVPYDASLDGAEVHYELCEHASIHPDPATIRDWSQEWQFLVSSYGQSDRTYIYTVNRTDVATGGSLTLRTQAEVDAFAASRINVVEGNLTIGVEGGEAIVNLDGLAGLVSVRCDLTVTNAYRGEDLAGLAGLRRCESLRIGSAGAPHETLKRIELPALREVAGDLQLCGAAVRAVAFAALQRVDGAFALSLPALEEVRGTLLCKNCGKTGAANSASFPRLRSIGRQLAFYVNVSSFASLAFPELERVGDGLGVSDDASSDYAFYTMPSGCTGAFVLPKLKEVRGNMLLSTWNASTDRVAAFRFPALETVTGELFVGHASYKNRTVTALDFSALRQVGSVYVGNLSSATDFSTFAGALPSLSDATWRVENCGENPTYEQMLGGQTGRP